MPAPHTPGSDPVYRFILYGRAKSGKTCYLAALAMAHELNPKGYTCDWLNTASHCPRPGGARETWNFSDPAVNRYEGREWLQQAIQAIEHGQVPPANPNESAPYRFLFEFRGTEDYPGSPNLSRTYSVEFIDYSGELIDPAISEAELARRVRQHMNEADGILILAEAPRREADWSQQHAELLKLRSAFHLIKRSSQHTPVALVLNKWDRLAESCTLESFLTGTPEPAHASLLKVLEAKAGEGNFRAFTVSALGPCEPFDDGSGPGAGERPRQIRPLLSTGLEDPFIWLARRRDELRLQAVRDDAASLHALRLWQLPTGVPLTVERRLTEAEPYLKNVPSWRTQLEGCRSRNRTVPLIQGSVLTFIVLTVLILTGMQQVSQADVEQFRKIAVSVRTSQVPTDPGPLKSYVVNLKEQDTWLTEYLQGSFWRGISSWRISRTEARAVLDDLRGRMTECETWIAQLKSREGAVKYYKELLDRFDQRVAGASQLSDLVPLEKDLQQVSTQETFRQLGDAVLTQYDDVREHLVRRRADLEDQTAAKEVERRFNACVASSDVVQAAAVLTEGKAGRAGNEVRQRLSRELVARAEAMLEAAVGGEVQQGNFEAAANLLKSTLNTPAVETLLGRDLVDRLRRKDTTWIWLPQDRLLYAAVLQTPSVETCRRYIAESRVRTMEDTVKKQLAFQERAQKPSDYTLKVTQLAFGKNSPAGTFDYYLAVVQVDVGTDRVLTTAPVKVIPNHKWTGLSGLATLRNRYRKDSLTVTVRVKFTNANFDDAGQATKTVSLGELSRGYKLRMSGTYENDVELLLEGFEDPPELLGYSGMSPSTATGERRMTAPRVPSD